MATLFTGGSVFDGHRHLPGHGLLVDDGTVVAVLDPDGLDTLDRRDARGRRPGRRPGLARLHRRPLPPDPGRPGADAVRPDRGQHARGVPRAWSATYAAGYDGPWITGGGWAMAAFPGGTPTAADLDAVVPDRPVLPAQPRPPRRLGQLAGPRAGRHHRRDPRPARRPDRAAPRRHARRAPCTRARWTSSPRCCPTCRRPSTPRGWSRGSATCSRSASPPGRTRSSAPTPAWPTPARRTWTRSRAATCVADVVGALWWDRELGLGQIPDLVERRRAQSRRPVPRDEHQDHAGRRLRELHRGDALAVPRRARARDRQRGPLVRRGRGAEGGRGRAGGRGLPGARARHRRPRHARGARRVRGRSGGGPRRRTCGTTSRTSR